jgi:hypothetical protein
VADLGTIRANLATRLATIAGLRAFAYIPDLLPVPAAFIGGPTSAKALTMGSNKRDWRIPVRIFVSRADDRVGQGKLDDYLIIGTTSIDDALAGDKTLGGVADFAVVQDSAKGYGVYEANGIKYWGFEVEVRIVA